MTDKTSDAIPRPHPPDGWRRGRIWIGAAGGAWFAGVGWVLDSWPLGAGLTQALRTGVDLSRLVLALPLVGFAACLLIVAGIATWRRLFRRAASSVLAVAALPVCYGIVAHATVLDPWLWYAIANKTRLEERATETGGSPPRFAVLQSEDMSSGFSGIDPNHFVLLVFDESDAVGLEPSERPAVWQTRTVPGLDLPIPRGRRLTGHFFRVDVFD